jgi:Ser/Thr protein kinase RdoA (MazF antagonist)
MVQKFKKAAHMDYKSIVKSVVQEDASLPHVLIYEHDKTKVYRIDLPTPLILRILEGDTSSQEYRAALQSELAADDDLTSKILYWETREINKQPHGIQIQTFIPGEPIDQFPNKDESQAVVRAVYTLHQRLSQAAERVGTNSAASIHALINQLLPAVRDCPIKTAATKLLAQPRYRDLISQPDQTLIYGDLWYKNLLLEKNGSETVVRFVDIDPLVMGPAILQPAILFSSYFLFTKLLFEPNAMDSFNLEKYLSFWPEPLHEFDMLLMMLVFPVGLGLLKEFQFSQTGPLDPQIRQATMEPFERSIAFLNKYWTARNYPI